MSTKPKKPKAHVDTPGAPIWYLNVVSSNIDRAAYHVARCALRIEFKNGSRYMYNDVSVPEFVAFTLAESKGKHLNEFIKPKGGKQL